MTSVRRRCRCIATETAFQNWWMNHISPTLQTVFKGFSISNRRHQTIEIPDMGEWSCTGRIVTFVDNQWFNVWYRCTNHEGWPNGTISERSTLLHWLWRFANHPMRFGMPACGGWLFVDHRSAWQPSLVLSHLYDLLAGSLLRSQSIFEFQSMKDKNIHWHF